MKNTKRTVICILFIIIMAMSLTSCTKDESVPVQGEVQNPENEAKKKEAQNIAGAFMDALCNMDASLMATMCSKPESLERRFPYEDFRAYVQKLNFENLSEDDEQKRINYLEPAISCYIDKVIQGNSYVIKETAKTDGGYKIVVTMETFDPIDVNHKAGAVMKEDVLEKKGAEISKKILEKGIINDASTEEEMISALYKGAAEEVIPMIESSVASSKKIKEDYIVYIIEKDGKLLVDVTRSTAVFALSPEIFKIY